MTTALPDQQLSDLQRFAEEIAAEAGAMAADGYGSVTAQRKYDGSLVTEIDEASDQLLCSRILAAFPDHAVLSEEQTTTYDPAIEFTWVIDPIDGTTNFARGLPLWGVSVGLLRHGLPIVASIVFPLLHEVFSASKGLGATRNGSAIRSSTLHTVENEFLLGTCTRTTKDLQLDTPLNIRNLGSAAYHVVKVADSTLLGCIEATPKIWDLAGPAVILQEAGGVLCQPNGKPVFPIPAEAKDYKSISIATMAAGNDALLSHLQAAVTERA